MEICFTDPDIGTVNLLTNYYWQKESAEHYRGLATEDWIAAQR